MIEIPYVEDSDTADEFVHYCIIIAKAFSDALDQNECNLKVSIGITEEIKDALRDVTDLKDIIERNATPYTPKGSKPLRESNTYIFENNNYNTSADILNQQDYADYLKDNCFKCEFGLPEIDIIGKFKLAWEKLKLMLDFFTDIFNQILDPNLCHAAFAFQYTCLPDILRLVALLLSVYVAVLALRKLGGISLNAFVKGVITGLLGQILTNFNIQIDFSKTGIGCVLNILDDLATVIPDGAALAKQVDPEALREMGIDPNHEFQYKSYIDQMRKQTNYHTSGVSNVFKYVTDVVHQATEDFNENLATTFGIIDYLQCEAGRSGSNFMELADYLQKLVTIINLLSSIAAMVAKKQIVERLCTTKTALEDFKEYPKEDLYTPLTDLDMTTVIEDFIGKVVEETKDENDDIIPIIIDKDKDPILPKLDFFQCNLTTFIEAHTIENITDKVIKDIIENGIPDGNGGMIREPSERVPTDYGLPLRPSDTKQSGWKTYPIAYVRPNFNVDGELTEEEKLKVGQDVNSGQNNALQSILDFVYNNPLDRPATDANQKTQADKGITIPTKKLLDDLKPSPSMVRDTSDLVASEAFENSCRHIDNMLDKIRKL